MAVKVHVIIYSLYHHVYTLAQEVVKGLESSGVEVKFFQVPEILSEETLNKMGSPGKLDLPIITAEDLEEADGFLFGFPTRFGVMPAQVKAFLDSTGGLWAKGALNGKMAGTFVSTGTHHGGQETTALTTIPYFVNHGIIYVPLGFTAPELSDTSEIIAGTPFGAGAIAGADGSRQPSVKELKLAKLQGESFGKIVSAYTTGLNKLN